MLLIQTLVKADLSKVPVAGVGGALFVSALAVSLFCLALWPLFRRHGSDGQAFTSIFQGATRWQTYVALSVSGNLFGATGLALASVAMVAIIPMVNVFTPASAQAKANSNATWAMLTALCAPCKITVNQVEPVRCLI
jgi:predicted permease